MRRLVWKRDRRGVYCVSEEVPVGRIPDLVPRAVVFMYPEDHDARNGSRAGGSGFVLGVTFADEQGVRPRMPDEIGPTHIYVVTNTHVARQCSIARVANPTKPLIRVSTWHEQSDGEDISIGYLGLQTDVYYDTAIDLSMLATKDWLDRMFVGVGDEVFMVGRFIGLDEAPNNTPVLRRGVLALSETVSVKNPRMERHPQESYVVEMHSRSGFSGSPVFLDLDPDHWMHERGPEFNERRTGSYLLGMTWGMFPHFAQILDAESEEPVNDAWVMTDNSGMELVVPAWKIAELIDREDVVAERKARENRHRLEERLARKVEATSAEKPLTRAQFDATLRKVSRRRDPSQSGEGTTGTSE